MTLALPDVRHPLGIAEYALIGDCTTAALVGNNGSIDWMCLPRFDGPACFAALLGTPEHGRFLLTPRSPTSPAKRRYLDDSLILESVFETEDGEVAIIDFMVPGATNTSLVRIVEGRRGRVPMHMELCIRFDYGLTVPWVTRRPGGNGIVAIAGPERLVLRAPVDLVGQDRTTLSDFTVEEGQRLAFVLTHGPSHLPMPASPDADDALYATTEYWNTWCAQCSYNGPYADQVRRSLLVLKGLTYTATGGIVAAPTTSLPEVVGGARNWDYRYCWLRDAVITLFAFMDAGYSGEADSWAHWLNRSVAGAPEQLQIMYGIGGERRLDESELPWLPGYLGSVPVRKGNAAAGQLQLDVYGEVMTALHRARTMSLLQGKETWSVQRGLLAHLEQVWDQPDEGMWETRGGRKPFTVSKIMAWLAFDCGVRDVEQYDLPGDLDRWRETRARIHADICEKGWDADRQTFTQYYGSKALDASLLLIPMTGFLPIDDPRMASTIAAVEKHLLKDGFVMRYDAADTPDGLEGSEGAFLACSFWLASCMHMQGRAAEAIALFERLVALCNDVGLLSEEYDTVGKRLVGNFPQAFSHVALVSTAMRLAGKGTDQRR